MDKIPLYRTLTRDDLAFIKSYAARVGAIEGEGEITKMGMLLAHYKEYLYRSGK